MLIYFDLYFIILDDLYVEDEIINGKKKRCSGTNCYKPLQLPGHTEFPMPQLSNYYLIAN